MILFPKETSPIRYKAEEDKPASEGFRIAVI